MRGENGLPDVDGVVVAARSQHTRLGRTPYYVRDREKVTAVGEDRTLLLPNHSRCVGRRGGEGVAQVGREPAGGNWTRVGCLMCLVWELVWTAKVEEADRAARRARNEIKRLEGIDVDGVEGVGTVCESEGWEFDAGTL